MLALALILLRQHAADWLASGLSAPLGSLAASALVWSAIALPAALLASLWSTRLQHETDFVGMYGANLVVNVTLILALAAVGHWGLASPVLWLGLALLCSMALRLGWLWLRQRRIAIIQTPVDGAAELPPLPVWLWAVLVSGLPLTLPVVARSIASTQGAGALATFNYAWKLVELPLVLAIQLVATLALPAIARAFGQQGPADAGTGSDRRARRLRPGLGAGLRGCGRAAGRGPGVGAAAVRLGPHGHRGP